MREKYFDTDTTPQLVKELKEQLQTEGVEAHIENMEGKKNLLGETVDDDTRDEYRRFCLSVLSGRLDKGYRIVSQDLSGFGTHVRYVVPNA